MLPPYCHQNITAAISNHAQRSSNANYTDCLGSFGQVLEGCSPNAQQLLHFCRESISLDPCKPSCIITLLPPIRIAFVDTMTTSFADFTRILPGLGCTAFQIEIYFRRCSEAEGCCYILSNQPHLSKSVKQISSITFYSTDLTPFYFFNNFLKGQA